MESLYFGVALGSENPLGEGFVADAGAKAGRADIIFFFQSQGSR